MRIDQIDERVIETTQFGGSRSHVNCALRTLRRMLGRAHDWGLARENKRTATFDPEEEWTALESFEQP